MQRALIYALALVLASGCDEPAEDGGDETIEAVIPDEAVVPHEATIDEATAGAEGADPDAAAYTIHEWGLIDVDLGDARAEYAAGPGQAEASSDEPSSGGGGGEAGGRETGGRETGGRRPDLVGGAVNTANDVLDILTGRPQRPRPGPERRKPVLYFHLTEGASALSFDITIDLGSAARMLEHYPAGALDGHQVRWSSVELGGESCTGGPYPTAQSDACQNVADDYCEAAELGAYESDDAGCLTVGGSQQNFLFYRGDGPAPDLPLTIERATDGTLTVTNTSLGEPVGELLRIRRVGGTIQVSQIAIPAAGDTVTVGLPSLAAADEHREMVCDQLRSIGLTEGEIRAFERAWFGELFESTAETPHAFPDAVLFFLPQAQVDGFAHIEATPAPSETVRAMAIRAGWTTL